MSCHEREKETLPIRVKIISFLVSFDVGGIIVALLWLSNRSLLVRVSVPESLASVLAYCHSSSPLHENKDPSCRQDAPQPVVSSPTPEIPAGQVIG